MERSMSTDKIEYSSLHRTAERMATPTTPYHPRPILSSSPTSLTATSDQPGASLHLPPPILPEPHSAQSVLKLVLVVSGVLSIAQYAIAIWLTLSPRISSISHLSTDGYTPLTVLPTLANLTTQLIQVWFGAAVALTGLWLWERRLARGAASFAEVGVWAGLVSNQAYAVFRNSRRLGAVMVVAYFGVMALSITAASAVVRVVTPTSGRVEAQGWYAAPAMNISGNDRSLPVSFEQIDFNNVIVDAMTSVNVADNVSSISIGGSTVPTAILGLANPAILQSFTSFSPLRPAKFASSTSFVNASLCMPGLAAAPTCTLATTPVALTVEKVGPDGVTPSILTANYTDSCAQAIESPPLYDFGAVGGFTSSTCNDSAGAHLSWVLFGAYTGAKHAAFPWNTSTLQFNCDVNLVPAARGMRVYRQNGDTGVEPDDSMVCGSGVVPDLTPEMVGDLASYVQKTLQPMTVTSPLEWVLYPAAHQGPPSNTSSTPAQLAATLAEASGLAFRALYTAFVSTSFTRDAARNVLNYRGTSGMGTVVLTREVYNVTVLGSAGMGWLAPLVAGMGVVVASLGLVRRRVGVFDPSDAEAVAAVAVGIVSGIKKVEEGGWEELK